MYTQASVVGAQSQSLESLVGLVKHAVESVQLADVESLMSWVQNVPNKSKIVSPGMRVAFSDGIIVRLEVFLCVRVCLW